MSAGRSAAAGTTSVRGPGQNVAASVSNASGSSPANDRTWGTSAASRRTGASGGLPLSALTRATAPASVASAAMP